MLADQLRHKQSAKQWQQKTRGYYMYILVLVCFILILILYIGDIYLLTSHPDTESNNILILEEIEDEQDDVCGLNDFPIRNKIYIYDLPYFYREQPRKHWYKWIHGKQLIYDNSSILNFAFGKVMNFSNDYYHTHMHSLEILFNERFKSKAKSFACNSYNSTSTFSAHCWRNGIDDGITTIQKLNG